VTENRYLLDNSTLVKLSPSQRASTLIRSQCRIPTEVLWEARGLPEVEDLHRYEYPMSPAVITQLRRVMASLPVDSVNVVDLYQNKGNGDPLLVAVALDARDDSEQTLLPETWHIVTDDQGLAATAATFQVPTLSTTDFAALLA
jgi:hypothetical protein